MIVSGIQSSKIDEELKKALQKASGHEPLRAVMVLGGDKPARKPAKVITATPNRSLMRQNLIDSHRNQITEVLAPIKKQLKDLTLTVKGGTLGTTVVVEGSAQAILSSLDITGVKHASLDRVIDLS